MVPSLSEDATHILATCRAAGFSLATAESCTGGLISGALTSVAGSSDVFDCGFVTYSYASKTKMLGVPSKLIQTQGAVCADVAAAMALGAINNSTADIAIAVTGVAGPGSSEHKPEGVVWFGACRRGEAPVTEQKLFGAIGRSKVRDATVRHAFKMIDSLLTGV